MTQGLAKAGTSKETGRGRSPACGDCPPFSSAWKLEEGIVSGQTTERVRQPIQELWFLFTN